MFSELLLEAQGDGATGIDPRQVRDEVMTMPLAGHETSAAALTWAGISLPRTRLSRKRSEASWAAFLAEITSRSPMILRSFR